MPRKTFYLLVLLLTIFPGFNSYTAQPEVSTEELLGQGLHHQDVEQNYEAAIQSYRAVLQSPDAAPSTAARALYRMGGCLVKLGRLDEARQAYEALLRDYKEQPYYSVQAQSELVFLEKKISETARSSGFAVRKIVPPIEVGVVLPPSPDGRYLAYAGSNPRDLVLEELATGKIHSLIKCCDDSGAINVNSILWSKDGNYILYGFLNRAFKIETRAMRIVDGWINTLSIDQQFLVSWDWEPGKTSILAVLHETPERLSLNRVSIIDGSSTMLRRFPASVPLPDHIKISPDGRFIAFHGLKPDDSKENDIYIWRLSDGEVISVTTDRANDELIDWAPDGQSLLFLSDHNGTPGFWKIPVTDGKPSGDVQLIKSDSGIISPLGITKTGILYYGSKQNQTEVFLTRLDVETGHVLEEPKPVNPHRLGNNSNPVWSSDGESLAYLCGSQISILWGKTLIWGQTLLPVGSPPICVYSLADGTYRQLNIETHRGAAWKLLAWSPDGNEILAMERPDILRIDNKSGNILARYNVRNARAMLPDGKTAVLSTRDPETGYISYITHDLITGRETQIHKGHHHPASMNTIFVPSPDGKWFALIDQPLEGEMKDDYCLTAVSIENGEVRNLFCTPHKERIDSIGWSHDGNHVLYAMEDESNPSNRRLWKIALTGGEPSELDLTSKALRDIAFHPDGSTLAFTSNQDSPTEIWALENFLPSLSKDESTR